MMNGHMNSFMSGYSNRLLPEFSQFGMMPYFSLAALVFLLSIALGFYLLKKNKTSVKEKDREPQGIGAEEMAKLRYARGEITIDELQNILKTIRL